MTGLLPDATPENWVDAHAPGPWRPWLKLARLDRPVGIWLLMLPGWQGIALAGALTRRLPDLEILTLFALGAVLMRAAGCAVNDVADRRIDAQVTRTAGRPVASGQISVPGAAAFALVCTLASAGVLLALNRASLWIAAASLPLVVLYPLMKRITWWPQAWLGLTFNWGALLGFAAALGGPSLIEGLMQSGPAGLWAAPLAPAAQAPWRADLCLYLGGVFWTLGYDTIYALQDMADDVRAGVKSSALRLGSKLRPAIGVFYGVSLGLDLTAGLLGGLGPLFWIGLLTLGVHLAGQVGRLRSASSGETSALKIFQSNTTAGLILFGAIAAGAWRF